jgi:predicted dehydrogenase
VETKVKTALIGCGNISSQYIKGIRGFDILDLAAVADLNMDVARARAEEFGIQRVITVDELLADPDIQIIVNLTVPKAHAEVSLAVVNAGKSVYSEKPLALNRDDGARILAAAEAKHVLVGCAPDTFLGGGIQTCRKLIDDGAIGEPIAAMAVFGSHGPESWHPNPFFYYDAGGGPMFDMGPYYLTALVSLLGPIKRVTGSARASFAERTATSQLHFGKKIPVSVPTHYAGVMDFVNGAISTIITSFDMWVKYTPLIEIFGAEGSLSVPDPNTFGGGVRLRQAADQDWREIPLTHRSDMVRGIGVADMAYALQNGRLLRASGEMAYHVLDAMQAFEEASLSGKHIDLASTCLRPEALPANLPERVLDA